VCMSFELLGDHLSDVLKQNGKPLKSDSIRDVSFQLLQAIAYVHSKNIIHTDLKAENILLMSNPAGALSVKVADFGSAIYTSAWHPPLVGTMHYRSPEAVLQAGWSYPLGILLLLRLFFILIGLF
jgi:serine/threonine protein kinase